MTVRPPLRTGEVRNVLREDMPASVLDIPEGFDPLADGVLMAHQSAWIADPSPLKLCEKGRRTGITWAEAHDCSLIAAASRPAGGDNVFYIPDVKEKGLEFIGYCAHFLRFIEDAAIGIEEYLEEIRTEDAVGNEVVERMAAYRIVCASGFRITGLSSRPASIRGLQGVVVIDEVAFHQAPALVIDACNALLIWGGRIRLISTHNGDLNAFNEIIRETREGKWPYNLHRYTFDDAVGNGLYERVALMRGWGVDAPARRAWYDRIRGAYGTRKSAMREELDAVPREGDGQLLALTWIEAAMEPAYTVARWEPPAEDFVDWPETARRAEMELWLRDVVGPLIDGLPENRQHFLGEDFAMRQDRSSFAVGYVADNLTRHVPLIVELRQCPYDQQEQALFFVLERIPRFSGGIMDAGGNGMVLAQKARQKFGSGLIEELMANDAWYREHTPRFRAAFEDRTLVIPKDIDVRDDLRLFQQVNGVGKIPRDIRNNGADGGRRHGDSAISLLNFYTATMTDVPVYEYEKALPGRRVVDETPDWDDDDDDFYRGSGLGGMRGAW